MIVFVSSVTGHIGHEDETIYTMTKFPKGEFGKLLIKNQGHKVLKLALCALVLLKLILELDLVERKKQSKNNWETVDDVAEGILYASPAKNKVWEIRMK